MKNKSTFIKLFIVVSSLLLMQSSSLFGQKIIGYIPQYRTIQFMDSQIEWDKMTDAYYFGSIPTPGGGISIEAPAKFDHVKMRANQAGIKTWLSVGGWGKSGNFIGVANSASARQAFANEALRLCQVHGLVGVDIDWEFPSYGQEVAFKNFFKTLYETLNPAGYLVSAAAGGEATHADKWLDETFEYIDDLNIMSYDAPGATTSNGGHASLQFMKDAMDLYHTQGCPYEKMLGGVAFYSRCAGVQMYNTIIANSTNKQATYENDVTSGLCYNGKNTIEDKIDYVMNKGGLGILIWEVTQDVKGQYSLLNVSHNKMQQYACPLPQPDLGSDKSICGSSSVGLDAGVSGSFSYKWYKNDNLISGASSRTYNAPTSGTYKVEITDGSCSYFDEIEVLGVLPSVDLGNDVDLCSPAEVTLDAGASGNGINYTWKKNSNTISGATTQTLLVNKAGNYEVTISASGCPSKTDQIVVTSSLVDVNDETVCSGQKATFTVNNPGSFDHKWYNVETEGSPQKTGNTFTTNNLTSTTSFYVEKDDPSGGICNGIPLYNSTTTYNSAPGTINVTYNGRLYENTAWWAKGYEPGVNPYWAEIGTCGSACERTKVTATIDNNCTITPTLSITADKDNVCEGTEITFTATPTDAGQNPILIWKVNGTQKQSSTSNTYTSNSLANNDVVEVSLSSDGSVKDSKSVTIKSNPNQPTINGVKTYCEGENLSLDITNASQTAGATYLWKKGNTTLSGSSTSYNKNNTTSTDDGSYTAQATKNGCLSNVSNPYDVTINEIPSKPTITANPNTNDVCPGDAITLTAASTTTGSSFTWTKGNASGNNNQNIVLTNATNGDEGSYKVTATKNNCASEESNAFNLNLGTGVTPSVSISASDNDICENTSVTFSATPTNGGTPSYEWYVNNNIQTETSDELTYSPANGDKVKVVMGTSLTCVSSSNATSNEITMNVSPSSTPVVSISEDGNNICEGTNITFTANVSNAGNNPTYVWVVNNTSTGISTSSFSSNSFQNNDKVKLIITSSEACSTGDATSNEININVDSEVTPTTSITADKNTICPGETVSFSTDLQNEGSTPSYDWFLNNNSTGITTSTYSNNNLQDGDKVKLIISSSETCVSTTNATSNEVTINVGNAVTPSVTISANSNNVCNGTDVTITANPTNGGGNPDYKWFINNNIQNETSNELTYTPTNGDEIKVEMTTALSCVTTSTATSNEITLNVTPSTTPQVNITESENNICENNYVSFSATVSNAGNNPSYDWLLNNISTGVTSPSYDNSNFSNGDVVKLIVTSSENCSSGNAESNEVAMNVKSKVVNTQTIPNQDLDEGFSSYQINLNDYFSSNGLIYTSGNSNVVDMTINNNIATISGNQNGTESITITATDNCNFSAQTTIQFTVTPANVINPTITIIQPSNTSITIQEGDMLNLGFNVFAEQGVLTNVSALLKDAFSGNTEHTFSLNNTGSNYSSSWMATDGTYNVVITAENSQGGITSKTINVTVQKTITNTPPSVLLTVTPTNGLTEGDLVTISWVADDQEGPIQSTVIKLDGVVQNWSSGDSWTATAGNHTISVVVEDSEGLEGSDQVAFSVANSNSGSNVSFISPTDGETIGLSGILVLVAIEDLDGIDSAKLMVINTNEDPNSPFYSSTVSLVDNNDGTFKYNWNPTTNSNYELKVVVTDNKGNISESQSINVIYDEDFGVGINDDLDPFKLSMVLYPNPTSDNATVDINIENSGNGLLELYNMSGSLVKTISSSSFSTGIQSKSIELEKLPVGVYLLKLTIGEEVITRKLIKE